MSTNTENSNDTEATTDEVKTEPTTATQPDRPAKPQGELFDPERHLPLSVLSERLDRARAAERARIAAEFGAESVEAAVETFTTRNRELTTLRNERDQYVTALDTYKAEQAAAERKHKLVAALQGANVNNPDKAVALAALDGIKFDEAFGEDGTLNEEAFAGMVDKLREGNAFLFGDKQSPGTRSNRQGNPPPPARNDVAKLDKEMTDKFGRL